MAMDFKAKKNGILGLSLSFISQLTLGNELNLIKPQQLYILNENYT
jgi:hypothetical protein